MLRLGLGFFVRRGHMDAQRNRLIQGEGIMPITLGQFDVFIEGIGHGVQIAELRRPEQRHIVARRRVQAAP